MTLLKSRYNRIKSLVTRQMRSAPGFAVAVLQRVGLRMLVAERPQNRTSAFPFLQNQLALRSEPERVNVEGATGTREVYAAAFEGPGNYTVEERAQISAIVNAGKKVDWIQVDFTLFLKKQLPTIPKEKLASLAKVLAEKFGVHQRKDFEILDLEDVKTKLVELNCLVGVELTSFMELAKKIKEIEQK